MRQPRLNTTHRSIAATGLILMAAALPTAARAQTTTDADQQRSSQPATAEPRRSPRPFASPAPTAIRKPLIDLSAQAKSIRDGQIVPGSVRPRSPSSPSRAEPPTLIDLPATDSPTAPPAVESARARVRDSARRASPEPVAPPPDSLPTLDSAPASVDESVMSAVAQVGEPATLQASAASPAPESDLVAPPARPEPPAGDLSETPLLTTRATNARPVRAQPPPTYAPNVGRSDDVANLGPARVSVLRVSGGPGVEWRSGDADWSRIEPASQAAGRVEVRAGLEDDADLIVDDHAAVSIRRLARVSIERAAERDGSSSVHIGLARGAIIIRPAPGNPATVGSRLARVRTPDRDLIITQPSEVSYDAFTGAKIRAVQP